jgi:hypothetical protein
LALTVLQFLQRGSANSKQIQLATGLSQAVVSRRLKKLSSQIITADKHRPPVYSLTRNAFGAGNRMPIVMVDLQGKNRLVGYLRPIEAKGFYLESNSQTPLSLIGGEDGYYPDLPYFLDDLRPQGFLGRQLAQQMAELSADFPNNLQYWTSNHIGRFLLSNGDDLPGNIKLGEQASLRLARKPKEISRRDYEVVADDVVRGENIGSSAGGEQPKFTVFNHELQRHVLVKFSPKGHNEIAQRWRDILVSEHYALQTLNNFGIQAAKTKIIETENRLFLESIRFDRQGLFGRSSMLSLQAIDMTFVGSLENWNTTMQALYKQKLCSSEDVETTKLVSAFGLLINNTDMHHGNISMSIKQNGFKLLPIYDMCCMGFAPKVAEVLPFKFSPISINEFELFDSQQSILKKMELHFWQNLSRDERISVEFRDYIKKSLL